MTDNFKILKARDIKDARDILAIINLWHNPQVYIGFQTHFCRKKDCTTMNCNYSHIKIRGYAAVRCTGCSEHTCEKHHISFRIVMIGGFRLELYTVCRRIAWEFEDIELFAKKRQREGEEVLDFFPFNAIAYSVPPITEHIPLPHPPIDYLSPSRLQPEKAKNNYTMTVVNNTSANEDREALKASTTYRPEVQSMIKRKSKEDGDLTVYYFRSTSTTKRALISMVSADDFKGQIKISEPHLQKAILKLPDEAIVAMKTELKEVPGASVRIKMAELRLENARLQKEIDDAKK